MHCLASDIIAIADCDERRPFRLLAIGAADEEEEVELLGIFLDRMIQRYGLSAALPV